MVLALVGAPTALAAGPWDGGTPVVSPLEAHARVIATKIAGRSASVVCKSPDEWDAFTKERGVGPLAGHVPLVWDARLGWHPGNVAEINPLVCQSLEVFWNAPDKSAITTHCQVGEALVKKSKAVRVRVKVKGRWVWRTKRKTIVESVPEYGLCPDVRRYTEAIQTIAHEPIHIGGVLDEGVTECWGMQHFAEVAEHFGAPPELTRELVAIFWTRFYPTEGPVYYRPDCQNGSALDLNPTSDIWP
jgi:hypothetical protein